jgi:hypothetical protein
MKQRTCVLIALVGSLFLFGRAAECQGIGGADFQVAYTGLIEQAPAIAYNSLTDQFLVCHKVQYFDEFANRRYTVQCQMMNANGTKSGGVLTPFGTPTYIDARSRPAIAYHKNLNMFFVAVVQHVDNYDRVIGRFLNGDGSNRSVNDILFNDSSSAEFVDGPPWPPAWCSIDICGTYGGNSLHVVANETLNEFVVTMQRTVYHGPERHYVVSAVRITESYYYPIVQLADSGTTPLYSHSIGWTPIGSDPSGGRYLFVFGGNDFPDNTTPTVHLLDRDLSVITPIPVTWGTPDGGVANYDIAYGTVGGRNVFLVAYMDRNNCSPGHDANCTTDADGNLYDVWTGIWGTYIDPQFTAYLNQPLPDQSFAISHFGDAPGNHVALYEQGPSVSYSPGSLAFFAVWREVPSNTSTDGLLSHIRGAFVDYYTENRFTAPSPGPGSNVVLSDDAVGPCTTTTNDPWYPACLSPLNPMLPAVAAIGSGSSAAVVWQQTYRWDPPDFDVMGDIFIGWSNLPDLVMTAVADPPVTASAGGSFSVSEEVANHGTLSAAASTTRHYLSIDRRRSTGDVLMGGTVDVPSLDVTNLAPGPVTLTVPPGTASGDYYVIACADDLHVVGESNETNNCSASATTVQILGVPATRVIALSGSLAFLPVPVGSTAGRVLTITNTGTGSLTVTGISYPAGFSGWTGGGGQTHQILPAQSQDVGVTFAPLAAQIYSGTITVTSDATGGTNTISVSGQGIANQTTTRVDFTGDGKADILWRHGTRGEVWLWPMNGAARTAETYVRTVGDTNWEIRGLGDQTGDGKADILWRNKTTGAIYLWPMNGSALLAETYVATVDPAYDIVGAGDFNGDGKTDILWRHLTNGEVWIWLMDGATPLSQVYVGTVAPAYMIKDVGDLDGDGKADIVWHHATAGEVWVWLMDGTARRSATWVGTVPDVGYQIQCVTDLTGDGKADILWHHATSGEVWLWRMDGTARLAESWVGTVPDTGYRIVGAGDYSGDGKSDILWHHATLGEVWVWLMDGTTRLSQTCAGSVADTGYQIVRVK